MMSHETVATVVSVANLFILSLTLWFLRAYTLETRRLARCAVEGMPRPCVVVAQAPDKSDVAVLEGMAASLEGMSTLRFTNIGSGPAVNLRFAISGQSPAGNQELTRGPSLAASETFDSGHPRQALEGRDVVRIEYESVSGAAYRSEIVIQDRRWVVSSRFIAA